MVNIWTAFVIGCAVGGLGLVAWLIGCVVQESRRMEQEREHHWMSDVRPEDLKAPAVWKGYRQS